MSTHAIPLGVLDLLRFTETHQRHAEALARATGEHFNIFNILRVGHLEVTTHTPILAELLNPKGSHGQGAAFLRLFLVQLGITGFQAESEMATVKMEYWAGPVTKDSGGRLDLVIMDGKGAVIVIENKIYAGDQENQLQRYRGEFPAAHLFYLTPKGDSPADVKKDELERIKCKCISYAYDILDWLKECRQSAACLPTVRETITQYIHLIEELTSQSTTTRMSDKLIKEIAENKDNLRAFFTLRDVDAAVRSALVAQLEPKLHEIAKLNGLEWNGPLGELHGKEGGFYFTMPCLSRHNLQIGFIFDAGGYRDFCFGYARLDAAGASPVEPSLLAEFRRKFPAHNPTNYWPVWSYWDAPYRYWEHEAFEAIRSGQFTEELKAKVEMLVKVARAVCSDETIKA